MTNDELNEILKQHREWLETNKKGGNKADLHGADLYGANLLGANLCGADLYGANLHGANLLGANLDFSAFPLWCGGLDVHIDDRQAIQILYHLVRNVLFSKNTSIEMKALCSIKSIVETANKFHRVEECGEISVEKEVKNDNI